VFDQAQLLLTLAPLHDALDQLVFGHIGQNLLTRLVRDLQAIREQTDVLTEQRKCSCGSTRLECVGPGKLTLPGLDHYRAAPAIPDLRILETALDDQREV
jgi:hypothetical protein